MLVVDTDDPPQFEQSQYLSELPENSAGGTLVKTLDVTSETFGGHLCQWAVEGVTPEVLSLFSLTTEPKACVVKVKANADIKWKKDRPGFSFVLKAVNRKNQNEQSRTTLNGNGAFVLLLLLLLGIFSV